MAIGFCGLLLTRTGNFFQRLTCACLPPIMLFALKTWRGVRAAEGAALEML
jgi:hypothetical protein